MTSFTHYILDGTKVVAQYQTTTSSITPSNVIYFYYDESGSPTGMKYNGNVYFFQKNLQGDIIRILNTQGSIVATYTYDAWGNIIASTDTSGVSIGTKNPFRYRGYYYDTETGLYYLNSRYYDPQVGRFLNADGFVSTGQGLLGNNMFAYCLNNPVKNVDHMGAAAKHILQRGLFGDGLPVVQSVESELYEDPRSNNIPNDIDNGYETFEEARNAAFGEVYNYSMSHGHIESGIYIYQYHSAHGTNDYYVGGLIDGMSSTIDMWPYSQSMNDFSRDPSTPLETSGAALPRNEDYMFTVVAYVHFHPKNYSADQTPFSWDDYNFFLTMRDATDNANLMSFTISMDGYYYVYDYSSYSHDKWGEKHKW